MNVCCFYDIDWFEITVIVSLLAIIFVLTMFIRKSMRDRIVILDQIRRLREAVRESSAGDGASTKTAGQRRDGTDSM